MVTMRTARLAAWLTVCAGPAGLAPAQPHEGAGGPPGVPARATCEPAVRAPGLRGFPLVRTHEQVNVNAAGMNIVGDAANETTIAVLPGDPNRLVIGWRQFDTITSDFREAGVATSHNGGRTWHAAVIDHGVFRTDPVLDFNSAGRIYYSSLRTSPTYHVDQYWSDDAGRTWQGPADAFGGDKQWIVVDRTGGMGSGHIYQAWNINGSVYGQATFNRSIDQGQTFSFPQLIPSRPLFGTLDVGPDGELYVIGSGHVVKSLNARDPSVAPVTFPQDVVVNLGGQQRVSIGSGPNPAGLLGQYQVLVDHSPGPRRGWVYALCSVDPPTIDPMDVMFTRSTDGGLTWSPPLRLNDDNPGVTNRWQWFGTMSIAPNGRLDVVWNDTRNSGNPAFSELYYTWSADGGVTWAANVRLTNPWNSLLGFPVQQKIGDYYHMRSDNVGAHLAWAATFNGEQDVYYMRIGDYDCNGNGVGDADDLAAGASRDANADGVPDECQCPGDWNWDDSVDSSDISAFLTSWLTGVGGAAGVGDVNADGQTSSLDISAFLTRWLAATQNGC